jgi:Ca2+-binding RTX toxin-like protein
LDFKGGIVAKNKRIRSIFFRAVLGCLVSTCIVLLGTVAIAEEWTGDAGNNIHYGTFQEDHYYGMGGNDTISGTPPFTVLNGLVQKPTEFGGRDILYGDDAKNTLVGNDTLIAGYEVTPASTTETDDTVWGGKGNDVLAGIWQENNGYTYTLTPLPQAPQYATLTPKVLTGWHDDYNRKTTTSIGNMFRESAENIANRVKNPDYQPNILPLGDTLIGGSEVNLYFAGQGDRIVENNTISQIWKYTPSGKIVQTTDRHIQPYKIASYLGTLDPNSNDYRTNTGFAGPSSFGLVINLFPTAASAFIPEDFTRGKNDTSIWFGVLDPNAKERGQEFLNYAPISQSADGDIIMRFKAGTMVIGSDGNYIFVQREDGKPLKNGDFGINFPVLKGYENHTNDYFIDSGLWQQDMLAELKRQGKGSDTMELVRSQTTAWLENILYPVLNPFGRAMKDGEAIVYQTVKPDNSLKKFAYDDYGRQIAPPVNVANR